MDAPVAHASAGTPVAVAPFPLRLFDFYVAKAPICDRSVHLYLPYITRTTITADGAPRGGWLIFRIESTGEAGSGGRRRHHGSGYHMSSPRFDFGSRMRDGLPPSSSSRKDAVAEESEMRAAARASSSAAREVVECRSAAEHQASRYRRCKKRWGSA